MLARARKMEPNRLC